MLIGESFELFEDEQILHFVFSSFRYCFTLITNKRGIYFITEEFFDAFEVFEESGSNPSLVIAHHDDTNICSFVPEVIRHELNNAIPGFNHFSWHVYPRTIIQVGEKFKSGKNPSRLGSSPV